MKFSKFLLSITPDDGICKKPEAFIADELGTLHCFLSADTISGAVKEAAKYEKLFRGNVYAAISEYVPSGIAPVTVGENKTVYMDIMRKSVCSDNEWITTLQAYLTNDYVITVYNKKANSFSQI
jgi:hypothetical protein